MRSDVLMALFSLLIGMISGIVGIMFRMILAAVGGFLARAKGYNFYLWGLITLIVPWTFLLILILPPKRLIVRSYLKKEPAFYDVDLGVGALMAVSAVIAKADGQVSKEEVMVIRRFVNQYFGLSNTELNRYEPAFNYGKEHPEELDEYVRILGQVFIGRNRVMAISYLLVMTGMANGELNQEEDALIRRCVVGMGLTTYEYESIKYYIQRMSEGNHGHGYRQYSQGVYGQGMNEKSQKEAYAKILGVPVDADQKTIKKAYRELAKEYHPDHVMSKGMPDEYVDYANKRFTEINEAYEYLNERAS